MFGRELPATPLAVEMFASADEEGSPNPLRFFGPIGYAEQDTEAKRVVRVRLTSVDDPGPDDYWAWLDWGRDIPVCIHATEEGMTSSFVFGKADVPGPLEEQKTGNGHILRLRVQILEEVALRATTRHAWRHASMN